MYSTIKSLKGLIFKNGWSIYALAIRRILYGFAWAFSVLDKLFFCGFETLKITKKIVMI